MLIWGMVYGIVLPTLVSSWLVLFTIEKNESTKNYHLTNRLTQSVGLYSHWLVRYIYNVGTPNAS